VACAVPFARPDGLGQTAAVHPVDALTRLGGISDRSTLLRLTSEKRLRSAVRDGLVARPSRGRYTLLTANVGLRAAGALSGTASHASAAAIHGWELATAPDRPAVVVPRNRNVPPRRRAGTHVRWRDLEPHEVHGHVTSPHRTVIDCARDLPFAEALAIADSALRHRDVDHDELVKRALAASTTRRASVRPVEGRASALAANPFESVLRAIALDVPGLSVEPQAWIVERGFRGRPDLVDRKRRIILEADSFEFHGHRKALKRDCERYTGLVIRGWTVVRFAWEHVMFEPCYVRDCLVALVEGPLEHAALPPTLLYSA
jgi:very-short-patch-repair endonuclease